MKQQISYNTSLNMKCPRHCFSKSYLKWQFIDQNEDNVDMLTKNAQYLGSLIQSVMLQNRNESYIMKRKARFHFSN